MPSIELDPLLRPDFSPLFSFDVQVSEKHETNRFHVLQSGDDFWLRLEGHADWLAVFDNFHGDLTRIAQSGDDEHFEFSLKRAVKQRNWGRALSLWDEKEELWRVLWKERRPFLMCARTREAVLFGGNPGWMRGAWIKPGAHFERQLRRDWRDAKSDLRAAHSFLSAGEEERQLWIVTWRCGSYTELRRVARMALQVEHHGGEGLISLSRPLFPTGPERFRSTDDDANLRLTRLWRRLLDLNFPVFDALARQYKAPRPFSFYDVRDQWPHLRIEVEEPSEHERLEARLQLRDWLRQNAPDLMQEWM